MLLRHRIALITTSLLFATSLQSSALSNHRKERESNKQHHSEVTHLYKHNNEKKHDDKHHPERH